MKDIEHVALNPLDRSGVGKMIKIIRDKQVLLDSDFTILYGVETKRINEQVKRNIERFPEKFCFQLKSNEVESVKSQIATSRGTGFFAGQKSLFRECKRYRHSCITRIHFAKFPATYCAFYLVIKFAVACRGSSDGNTDYYAARINCELQSHLTLKTRLFL